MIVWPWIVLLVAGLALQAVGLRSTKDRWPPLTDVIRRYVPPVMIAAALAWLAVHFGVNP